MIKLANKLVGILIVLAIAQFLSGVGAYIANHVNTKQNEKIFELERQVNDLSFKIKMMELELNKMPRRS